MIVSVLKPGTQMLECNYRKSEMSKNCCLIESRFYVPLGISAHMLSIGGEENKNCDKDHRIERVYKIVNTEQFRFLHNSLDVSCRVIENCIHKPQA